MNLLQKVKHTFSNGTNGNGHAKTAEKKPPASLQDHMPFAIAYISSNYHYRYVNKAYADVFSIPTENVPGKSVMDVLGMDAFQQKKPRMDEAMKGQQLCYEDEILFKDGNHIIEERYIPDFDDAGNINGCIALISDITGKKRTEDELQRTELEIQNYTSTAKIGMHWVDAKGIIIWANQAELDMLGYSAQEYIGQPVALFHRKKEVIDDIMSRLLNNEAINNYESELLSRNGSFRSVLISSNGLWKDGKFLHTRCFTTDISEQKRLFRAQYESESQYRQLLKGLPVALYTCDKEGRILLYNQAAVDLWGREPEAGKDMWCGSWKIYKEDGITPMDLDACPMAITLKEGREVKGAEIIIERPDGVRRNVAPHPVPIFDDNGNVTGAVNMLVDITDRKIAEQKVNVLAAIVDSSNDAIISKTLNGIVTSWNEASEKIFGYTADEMIGQSITKLIPPDRIEEEPRIIQRLKKGEIVDHFETRRLRKDNTLIDISLTISPVKDSQGIIIGASKIARDITEQKRLNEALHESEERFRMAAESSKLGAWEFYPSTEKFVWSKESKKMHELSAETEIDYRFFLQHIHPEDVDLVHQEIQKAMEPGQSGSFDIQYRILRDAHKKPRWIRTQGKVYFDNTQKPERFIGTMLDITEEKTQEEQLKDSIELFTTMADNVPAMIWMSGDDKFCDFFNKTWLEFTGRSLKEEGNEGWLENVHPEDVQICIDNYNKSFGKEEGFYTEYRLKRHDGVYRWIADHSVPRYNHDGSFAGFISACIDIDDQKNTREKIMESELRLKTISSAAPVGLWMTDELGQTTFVNDTWIAWTANPFEKQLGTGWLDRVLEEDKVNTPSLFLECMQKKEKFSTEFRLLRADGELRWCLTEGSPYYNADGAFAGYAGSVTDITDMKRLEQRKDDFIKMASHELKTPITSIKGYVQLLLNIYDELNEEKLQVSRTTVRSSLNTISKQVSKLTRLISELLDLSRIESGKLELNKTVFDLGDLVEETVQDVRQTISKHAIIINNDFEGKVYADKERLEQVLLNLLTNAVKYSPDGDKIDITVGGNAEVVIIKVRDYGIGIDKKDHYKIFERFYRVEGKSEQTYPGFGIGLFIAREIIQRHHGTIAVESEKDKGSVFIITLPLSKNSQIA